MRTRRNYILPLLFALIVIIIGVWIVKIVNDTVPFVDQWTRGFVQQVDDTFVYTFFRWVTDFGSQPFLLPFTIIMAFVLWGLLRDWLPGLMFSLGTLFTHLFNLLIKELVERSRPSVLPAASAEGHSFPSGHAMISMVCYGLLAYFIAKRIRSEKAVLLVQLFFAIVIFLIGMSRYFINVHYLTDVVAGYVIGFICLVGLISLYRMIQRYRSPSQG
ncbi:phosphatase PAP2 family protein [Lentibacillus sediminis]|uniref:phosphatase PAP2 family protein n=1 Tax=Lentibacillus sediminis TaxID=1940529 RepID=UPI000C1C4655|nr:phosphatase PAP2 family protein [Lentibacillus sediminis]